MLKPASAGLVRFPVELRSALHATGVVRARAGDFRVSDLGDAEGGGRAEDLFSAAAVDGCFHDVAVEPARHGVDRQRT